MATSPHIIVAIDFTPACRRALQEAMRRALEQQARITAVHAMDAFLADELAKALSIDESAVRAEWEAKLRKFVDSVSTGGVPVGVEVRLASPYEGIVDACHAHRASLLVMGTCGSGKTTHRVGTVAGQCVRSAPVNVMLVRPEAPERFKTILVCVDFSSNSHAAVESALKIADIDGACVYCLFVYQSALAMALSQGGFVTAMPSIEIEDIALATWRTKLDNFIDPIAKLMPNVVVKKRIDDRVLIRESIVDTAEEISADLVVLGTRSKGGLRHMLIGTTAEKIVQHAPCSILAIKPSDSTAT
jgi:universal stress protein E